MAQEFPDPVDFTSKPDKELVDELEQAADNIEGIGYPIPSMGFLVTGTFYRRDTLYADRLNELRRVRRIENSWEDLSKEEKEELYKQVVAGYEPYSTNNLTETLRYQYDRKTREDRLRRPPFPADGSPAYDQISKEMAVISSIIKVLVDRYPDRSHFDYLPTKRDGKWQVPKII